MSTSSPQGAEASVPQSFDGWFQRKHPAVPFRSAEAVLRLLAEGATLPFIARYRKEQTGNLDEVAIQSVIDAKETWDAVINRQKHILSELERQKKLTPELKERILSMFDPEGLEDLYLPYKQKRKTKAELAREAGLGPLAEWIWGCAHGTETPQPGQTLEIWAFTFRNEEKDIKDAAAAIGGAQDILIERLSETEHLRKLVRTALFEKGVIRTSKGTKAKPHSKFENYFDYHELISSLLQPQNSHRYLALRRGWMEEELQLSMGGKPDSQGSNSGFEQALLQAFESEACTVQDSPGSEILKKAARLALKAHVVPSIENEVHKALAKVADEAAIAVFSENVRKLLMAAPFGPKAVLGVDPGIRTGCKLAVVDDSGKYIASTVLHLQSDSDREKARALLTNVVREGNIRAVAVGNGTAGRETETFIRGVLKEAGQTQVPVVMVSEAGASVYSASEVAREEFPELDVTVRGAISIARRLQDPLSELVKIEPKSIGVGQYQHDVSQPALKKSLEITVDSCVNQVGVNLNTASYHLLAHVAGIGDSLARAIVERRAASGLFRSREQLLDVPRFSKKAFEQAAGFLRIPEGENPLDNTGVHPERYPLIETRAKALGKTVKDFLGSGVLALKEDALLREEAGPFTFDDIIRELEKPGRDPRDEFVPFQFRDDIHELKDLQPGMTCPGIVTNVTNFGAFVDIGVHQDGLVHLSQLANRFVKDPREVVSPGDRVQVRVLEVNTEKNQISLSMKTPAEAVQTRSRGPRSQEHPAGASAKRSAQPRKEPHSQPRKPMPKRAPRPLPPKPVFNNAFAGLASLRDQLKKK